MALEFHIRFADTKRTGNSGECMGKVLGRLVAATFFLYVMAPISVRGSEPESKFFTRQIKRQKWNFAVRSLVAPQSAHDFCQKTSEANYAQALLANTDNWLGFENQGGLFNGGVCWWHSRFTRNAAQLVYYSPAKAKPTDAQARDIINWIRHASRVVEIPGFANLREFSTAHQKDLQKSLEEWQRWDGFVLQRWVVGLAGRSKRSALRMKKDMDQLYQQVAVEKKVVYQKLQLPGVTAHAWLVIDMQKTSMVTRSESLTAMKFKSRWCLSTARDNAFLITAARVCILTPDMTRSLRTTKILCRDFANRLAQATKAHHQTANYSAPAKADVYL